MGIDNLGGNYLILTAHFFVGFLVLWLVELRLCSFCQRLSAKKVPAPKREDQLNLDEDVLEEEERVWG